jgi:hypothetical protein
MKLVLLMYLCSATANQCMSPYQVAVLDNHYDCMMRGYSESAKQTEEMGIEQTNKLKIYFRFHCKTLETKES